MANSLGVLGSSDRLAMHQPLLQPPPGAAQHHLPVLDCSIGRGVGTGRGSS